MANKRSESDFERLFDKALAAAERRLDCPEATAADIKVALEMLREAGIQAIPKKKLKGPSPLDRILAEEKDADQDHNRILRLADA